MNARWLIPVLSAMAAGVVAFGAVRYAGSRPEEPGLAHLQDMAYLTRALDLNDAQAREVAALHDVLGAKLQAACVHHCAARVHLGETLIDAVMEEAEIEALLQDMGRAYLESERAVLEHIRDMHALLRPEQIAQFNRMIRGTFCRTCPVCRTGANRRDPAR